MLDLNCRLRQISPLTRVRTKQNPVLGFSEQILPSDNLFIAKVSDQTATRCGVLLDAKAPPNPGAAKVCGRSFEALFSPLRFLIHGHLKGHYQLPHISSGLSQYAC